MNTRENTRAGMQTRSSSLFLFPFVDRVRVASRERELWEKEQRSRRQYERSMEERGRRLEEQRQREERRRTAVEQKRRRRGEEEKVSASYVLSCLCFILPSGGKKTSDFCDLNRFCQASWWEYFRNC